MCVRMLTWRRKVGLEVATVPGWEGTLDCKERETVVLYQLSCGSITVTYKSQLLDRVGIMGYLDDKGPMVGKRRCMSGCYSTMVGCLCAAMKTLKESVREVVPEVHRHLWPRTLALHPE
jgi:hypothetical protein